MPELQTLDMVLEHWKERSALVVTLRAASMDEGKYIWRIHSSRKVKRGLSAVVGTRNSPTDPWRLSRRFLGFTATVQRKPKTSSSEKRERERKRYIGTVLKRIGKLVLICTLLTNLNKIDKSNNRPQKLLILYLVLSWKPWVLWGFWNTQDGRFFDLWIVFKDSEPAG